MNIGADFEGAVLAYIDSVMSHLRQYQLLSKPQKDRGAWTDGASGTKHHIDVRAELQHNDTRCLLLVECKCLSEKVGLEDVLCFLGRVVDIKPLYQQRYGDKATVEALMYTKVGWTGPAKKLADHHQIGFLLYNEEGTAFALGETRSVLIRVGAPAAATAAGHAPTVTAACSAQVACP